MTISEGKIGEQYVLPSGLGSAGPVHGKPSLWKRLLLAALFLGAFLALDGSSTASQHWQGAPPWYLPVGLSLAVFICAGWWSISLVFLCSLIAAKLNYHRPIFSWNGIPGAIGVYLGYAGTGVVLRKLGVDLRRGRVADLMRYLVGCLGGSIVSLIVGILTILADHLIGPSEIPKTMAEWWASDALAIVAFAPFLIVFVAPVVRRWLTGGSRVRVWPALQAPIDLLEALEIAAQSSFVVLVIWLAFDCELAIPFQPLYLLFIPVIWVAVRRGFPGAALIIFAITLGMNVAATQARIRPGSLPKVQLATLALGLTGLCLGAVVTERQLGEKSLRESEKRYRHLFERNLAGVVRSMVNGEMLECNVAAAALFGYDSIEDLLSTPITNLYETTADRELMMARLESEGSVANHQMRLRRKNGELIWAIVNSSVIEYENGEPHIVQTTLFDINDRKLAEEQVQYLAYYDSLTALPNRTLLRDRLSQALAAAARREDKVAIVFVDLDNFKTINDSLGHSVGDFLLKEVAGRLKARIRGQDTIARLGGDEFLIVLTGLKSIPDIAIAAEKFMDVLTPEFQVQGHSLSVRCSIGLSVFPDDATDAETLIKYADSAMYNAKERGRYNFQFFTAKMDEQAIERLKIENGLRCALEKGQFSLVYQPQLDLSNGTIFGFEALLRWRHPEMGMVPPDRFIRVAENSGLILPIGDWVLRTACSDARKLQESGITAVPVAVNVSALQFRDEKFCERVRAALKETGLEPQHLELELTESMLLEDADLTGRVLQELKKIGISVAIDDFGTGYSSLSYLKRFAVNKLKIDRSFVRDVAVNGDDAAIAAAIIGLGNTLKLDVIAEGVENAEQISFLREQKCGAIQGYYFCKPVPLEELALKLREHRALAAGVS